MQTHRREGVLAVLLCMRVQPVRMLSTFDDMQWVQQHPTHHVCMTVALCTAPPATSTTGTTMAAVGTTLHAKHNSYDCVDLCCSAESLEELEHQILNLAAALRQLPLLRQLSLSSSSPDDTDFAAISGVEDWQAIPVESVMHTSTAVLAALPASLSQLELKGMRDLFIEGSAANSLAALTQLQHLQLQRIGGLAPTALGSLTQLTHLHLQELRRTPEQDQQLLPALARLQQLRHLHAWLWDNDVPETAAQWTALVASTQLTYLSFTGVGWQPGECATGDC
jgi:hypothetical protein